MTDLADLPDGAYVTNDPECEHCTDFNQIVPDWLGPNHCAPRFEMDWRPIAQVWIDGINVTDDCVEAFEGDPGWVILITDNPEEYARALDTGISTARVHVTDDRSNHTQEIFRRGQVRFERMENR